VVYHKFIYCFGYYNASDFKVDLTANYLVKSWNTWINHELEVVTRSKQRSMNEENFLNLKFGVYHSRRKDLTKAGSKGPWRDFQNYLFDIAYHSIWAYSGSGLPVFCLS